MQDLLDISQFHPEAGQEYLGIPDILGLGLVDIRVKVFLGGVGIPDILGLGLVDIRVKGLVGIVEYRDIPAEDLPG
jgi:hypothetical protein